MSKFHEIDTVKILVPVSGTSEVKRESVSFPAGTEGTLIVAGNGGWVVDIGWSAPYGLSCDWLIVALRDYQMELA